MCVHHQVEGGARNGGRTVEGEASGGREREDRRHPGLETTAGLPGDLKDQRHQQVAGRAQVRENKVGLWLENWQEVAYEILYSLPSPTPPLPIISSVKLYIDSTLDTLILFGIWISMFF